MAHNVRLMLCALKLAERGMSVFPLHPGSKTPALARNWEAQATTHVDQIERWWMAAPYNVGVATGTSRLLVVDLDSPKEHGSTGAPHGRQVLHNLAREHGETVPRETFTIATAGGGLHLYFEAPREPTSNSVGRLGPHIDTRSRGGFVVGPGSTVGGRRYRVICDQAPAPAPDWMVKALRPTVRLPLPCQASDLHRGVYVRAAIDGETRNVDEAPVGRRNHVLFVAAARLGRFVTTGQLSAHEVHTVLATAADRHVGTEGFTTEEVRRTIEKGLRRSTSTQPGHPAIRAQGSPPLTR
ncbi:bifunctional DNA primase/polymerase [Pseudonocardia sp. GCM10023141]|uniref:bifunctional DNA primase/polymerase n=1 Tax=Pseudonocardia sp. GCM10023141 TaxID=3252653 RepID=UPI003622F10D